jgi:hypothetical protein
VLKQFVIDGYAVYITETAVQVMFGAWSFSAWVAGRKEQYNTIKPNKPIVEMKKEELKTLARAAVKAGLDEKRRLNTWLDKTYGVTRK